MKYELQGDRMLLAEAALVAHRRLFSRALKLSPDALDLIATALSGHLEVFGFRASGDDMTALTETDYARGAFRRGASRFEYSNGESIIVLAVARHDFERAMAMLASPPSIGSRFAPPDKAAYRALPTGKKDPKQGPMGGK